jgi:hypothetical protein
MEEHKQPGEDRLTDGPNPWLVDDLDNSTTAQKVKSDILTLDDSDESIKEYVNQRKLELQPSTKRSIAKMDFLFNPLVDGFFDESVHIAPGINERASFVLDDDSMYVNLVKKYRKVYERHHDQNGDFTIALASVQYATCEYFGNLAPSGEQVAIRSRKFDTLGAGQQTYSISDGKEGALCSERAAVAHDLALFLGLDSQFTAGHFTEDYEDGESVRDLHQFLIIEDTAQGHYLYDPTNPRKLLSEDLSSLRDYAPYTIKIDQQQGIEAGTTVVGDISDKYIDENGEFHATNQRKRTYNIGR